jgi:hypothetical protein
MLGRIIEIDEDGITWRGDPRHLELLREHFGMNDNTNVLTKNGYDDDTEQGWQRPSEDLTAAKCKNFRMLAARLNYMAQDNPTIQFPAKEVCRHMAKPRIHDFLNIKRTVRFMLGMPEVGFKFKWQGETEAKRSKVYVDSDWAGCKATRKSTSGGVLKVGQHVIKTWSSTQSTVATSSGEAELLAMYDGTARGVGLLSILSEIRIDPALSSVRVCTHSAVAKSFTATRGLGRTRHVDVKLLWLQVLVHKGRLKVHKISGVCNFADALTKYHGAWQLRKLLEVHGVVCGPGGVDRRAEGGCGHKSPPTDV